MFELIYTSVPRGIRGDSGYTVAAHTGGMPPQLIQAVQGLSIYQHIDKNPMAFANNPVGFSHLTMGSGAGRTHVISRIAACPPDYTGRTNFIAHHLALSSQEASQLPDGPAAVAAFPGVFLTSWTGDPQLLPARLLPSAGISGDTDAAWTAAGLDPRWADYLVHHARREPSRPT